MRRRASPGLANGHSHHSLGQRPRTTFVFRRLANGNIQMRRVEYGLEPTTQRLPNHTIDSTSEHIRRRYAGENGRHVQSRNWWIA